MEVAAAGWVAVLHGLTVAFVLTGSLLALRWPRVLWLHVPVGLTVLALYLTGSDCPLTALELWLRQRAGQPGYADGFIGHYLTDPWGLSLPAASTQVGLAVIAFLPNVVGYGLLLTRSFGGPVAVRPRKPVVSSGRDQDPADLVQ